MQHIILLSGFCGSGKDTVGKLIISNQAKFIRLACADKCKDEAAEIYKFKREYADDPLVKDLVVDGQMSIRDQCRQVWLNYLESDPTYFIRQIVKHIQENNVGHVVLTDFRYPFEFETLKQSFPRSRITTWRINSKRITPPAIDKSPEEYALQKFQFTGYLSNHNTLKYLEQLVEGLILFKLF